MFDDSNIYAFMRHNRLIKKKFRLKHYLDTKYILGNRNVVRYNLRTFTSLKSAEK